LFEHGSQQFLRTPALAVARENDDFHEIVHDPMTGTQHDFVQQGRTVNGSVKNRSACVFNSMPHLRKCGIPFGKQLPLRAVTDNELGRRHSIASTVWTKKGGRANAAAQRNEIDEPAGLYGALQIAFTAPG
jgi:hypothetical protein